MLPEIIPNLHPIFVHFTIALFSISTLLLVVGSFANLKYREALLNTAYINLWLGCLLTTATIAAGFYAYNTVDHDELSHAAMTNHKNWAISTAIAFWALGLWSVKLFNKNDKANKFLIILMICSSLTLAVTGWKGGEVVYRFGIGVMSLPNTDSHEHGSEKEAVSESHDQHMKDNNEEIQNTKPHMDDHSHGSK